MPCQAPDTEQGLRQTFDPLPRELQNECQLIDIMCFIFIEGIKPFERKGLERLPQWVGILKAEKFYGPIQKTDNPIRGKKGLPLENGGVIKCCQATSGL